jgi:Iron-containing redox enzyme
MVTSSERLRRKIGLVLPEYRAPGHLLLEHADARELYPRYMGVVYHVQRNAVHLLETALVRSRELAERDPVARALVPYLERHVEEERHGDRPGEALLDDLASIDMDTRELRERPPPAAIAALIGSWYFWVLRFHPVALLGCLAVIEGYHPRREGIEALMQRTGLPRSAFGQLLEHAELDVAHSEEIDRLLDALPLQPRHEEAIGICALQTVELLSAALLEMLERPFAVSGPAVSS